MAVNLSTKYDPKQVENKWYTHWEENGYFHQEVEKNKKPFSIVIPPPNVTGSLHLGHAFDNTLQDILVRWKRMQGYNTVWIPGTDHAGIATQAKVEEKLAEEGLSKYDLGREKFLERVWEWKNNYGNKITRQLRLLGASCDWERERFTMDEGCSRAVREVFVRLYKKGLIYRGSYIINWCPKCHTTISDIEVEHKETLGNLYHVKYPFSDGSGYVVVATTRPETIMGDTAVAVHPEDERYRGLIGKTVVLPVVKREIPIIADEYVDPEFGSGAVKITPAHDPNDFEVAQRHDLEHVVVIDKKAKMTEEAGPYEGMDRYECRNKLVQDLSDEGYLVNIEEHGHSVGHCYRCDTVIEPLVSPQWFVKMEPLAKPAIEAAKNGDLRFVPERFTKIYLNWLENIRDWCISRQLWWGHRIPVWYCEECGETICATEDPTKCCNCNSEKLMQDPDVLDTWFSSALWPFSTMGWPEETEELKHFYPTSVLVTGRDIIFFWVARMIFMALEFMKKVPFKDIFIHGLILDAQGRKMSKSLGNGVDPIEVIDEYGADSLRFMIVTGNTPGNDLRFHFERLGAARNFANKIWNASRFALMNLEDYEQGKEELQYTLADKWILTRLAQTIKSVNRSMEKYELGEAARILYEFIWSEFCDWYIELVKPRLYGKETDVSKYTAQHVLYQVLAKTMQLLHPFMPFITEEIWHHLPYTEGSIMLSSWPESEEVLEFVDTVDKMNTIMEIIRGLRNIRGEMNVAPSKKAHVIIYTKDPDKEKFLRENVSYIANLVNAEPVELVNKLSNKPEKAAIAVVPGVEAYMPLEGLIDIDLEIKRLQKEKDNLNKELQRIEKKLANEGFLNKAPAEVVEKEKIKKEETRAKLNSIQERLGILQG
ncbi:MAG: valyl-tRNA synthetase [Clostridia bacterium]|jgi:valyl-tRNA synthetase|nr:valyl-tRNA synthetase [Clostridiales bacterium]MDK2984462.1 valyl-tRNA synthetase [Clostridia bacterium]